MNTLITIAEGTLFCLILLLGGVIAPRTGRRHPAVLIVWFCLVLITIPLALVNLAWADASSVAAFSKASTAERDRLHELVNLFPDGTHVLASIAMGWFYGLIAAGIGLRLRKGNTDAPTDRLLKTEH